MTQWKKSHDRFCLKQESLEAIAMSGERQGESIELYTVYGHILIALAHGCPVDLLKLLSEAQVAAPDEAEWQKIESSASEADYDPNQSPIISSTLHILLSGAKWKSQNIIDIVTGLIAFCCGWR
jgi:hypothetical protein